MNSKTLIQTDQAKRIAKRLLNHWKHKFEVAETENEMSIYMPDATVVLTPKSDHLNVSVDTKREDFTFLEKVVIDHLNRMAQQEFEVEWSHHA